MYLEIELNLYHKEGKMIACMGPEDNCKMILSIQCKSTTSAYIKNKIKVKSYGMRWLERHFSKILCIECDQIILLPGSMLSFLDNVLIFDNSFFSTLLLQMLMQSDSKI